MVRGCLVVVLLSLSLASTSGAWAQDLTFSGEGTLVPTSEEAPSTLRVLDGHTLELCANESLERVCARLPLAESYHVLPDAGWIADSAGAIETVLIWDIEGMRWAPAPLLTPCEGDEPCVVELGDDYEEQLQGGYLVVAVDADGVPAAAHFWPWDDSSAVVNTLVQPLPDGTLALWLGYDYSMNAGSTYYLRNLALRLSTENGVLRWHEVSESLDAGGRYVSMQDDEPGCRQQTTYAPPVPGPALGEMLLFSDLTYGSTEGTQLTLRWSSATQRFEVVGEALATAPATPECDPPSPTSLVPQVDACAGLILDDGTCAQWSDECELARLMGWWGFAAAGIVVGEHVLLLPDNEESGLILHPATRSWRYFNYEAPREGPSALAIANDRAVFVGGRDEDGNLSGAVDVYDLATGRWEGGGLVEPRIYSRLLALADGALVVLGGISLTGPSDRVDLFDPATLTTVALPSLPHGAENLEAWALESGEVLAFEVGDVEVWVGLPREGSWRVLPAPGGHEVRAVAPLGTHQALVFVADRQLSYPGFRWSDGTGEWIAEDAVEALHPYLVDLASGTWAEAPLPQTPRVNPTLVARADGVLMVGGDGVFLGPRRAEAVVELLTPGASGWTVATDVSVEELVESGAASREQRLTARGRGGDVESAWDGELVTRRFETSSGSFIVDQTRESDECSTRLLRYVWSGDYGVIQDCGFAARNSDACAHDREIAQAIPVDATRVWLTEEWVGDCSTSRSARIFDQATGNAMAVPGLCGRVEELVPVGNALLLGGETDGGSCEDSVMDTLCARRYELDSMEPTVLDFGQEVYFGRYFRTQGDPALLAYGTDTDMGEGEYFAIFRTDTGTAWRPLPAPPNPDWSTGRGDLGFALLSNTLWYVDSAGALVSLDLEHHHWETVRPAVEDGDNPVDIFAASEGELWLDVPEGLQRYDIAEGTLSVVQPLPYFSDRLESMADGRQVAIDSRLYVLDVETDSWIEVAGSEVADMGEGLLYATTPRGSVFAPRQCDDGCQILIVAPNGLVAHSLSTRYPWGAPVDALLGSPEGVRFENAYNSFTLELVPEAP